MIKSITEPINYLIHYQRLFTLVFMVLLLGSYCQRAFGQVNGDHKTFVLTCKESESQWKTMDLDGVKFKYCFLEKLYKDTNADGTDNFSGTVLLDIVKGEVDSLTAWRMCATVSRKIKLKEFYVLTDCQARKIFVSASGPRNEEERKYLDAHYLGYYKDKPVK